MDKQSNIFSLQDYSLERRREAAIRSLVVYLRENEEDLFKEHSVSQTCCTLS